MSKLRKSAPGAYDPLGNNTSHTQVSLLLRLGRNPDDRAAWHQFEARYRPKILMWCRCWGLQEADAHDVAQTVLLQIAIKMRTFVYDPSRSFRGWLRTLTRHAWADFLGDWRRRVATGSGEDAVMEQLQTVEARLDLERRLEEEYDLELLELATGRVRARVGQRTWQAFRLTAIESLTGLEAAERLGMAPTAVYQAKSTVLRMIREEIAQLEDSAT